MNLILKKVRFKTPAILDFIKINDYVSNLQYKIKRKKNGL